MKTLTYGNIPADLTIDEPYPMQLTANDEKVVCGIINQGIDSHLEAVFFDDHGVRNHKRCLDIRDSASMRCLLRRLMETEAEFVDDDAMSLASDIMSTLGYEWV